MDEPETKICSNCNREIPSVNHMIHSVHCARNIKVCPVCKEPVPHAELQHHHDQLHKLLPCKQCGENVCGTDLEDHIRDSCANTIKSCRFCDLELPRSELPPHEGYCGVRTEQCPECREWVMIKYRQLHLDSNHGFLRLDDDPPPIIRRPPTRNLMRPLTMRNLIQPSTSLGANRTMNNTSNFNHLSSNRLANRSGRDMPGSSRTPLENRPLPNGLRPPQKRPNDKSTAELRTALTDQIYREFYHSRQALPIPLVLDRRQFEMDVEMDMTPDELRARRERQRDMDMDDDYDDYDQDYDYEGGGGGEDSALVMAQGSHGARAGLLRSHGIADPDLPFRIPENQEQIRGRGWNSPEDGPPERVFRTSQSSSSANQRNPMDSLNEIDQNEPEKLTNDNGHSINNAPMPYITNIDLTKKCALRKINLDNNSSANSQSGTPPENGNDSQNSNENRSQSANSSRNATSLADISPQSSRSQIGSPAHSTCAQFGSSPRSTRSHSSSSNSSAQTSSNSLLNNPAQSSSSVLNHPAQSSSSQINSPSQSSSSQMNSPSQSSSSQFNSPSQSTSSQMNTPGQSSSSQINNSSQSNRAQIDNAMQTGSSSQYERFSPLGETDEIIEPRRYELKNLKPMTHDEFMNRFNELQLGRDRRQGGVGRGQGSGDRFSEIKSSLRELRRGLNEVTAPYNSNISTTRSPEDSSSSTEDLELPCEFCDVLVPAEDLVQHQTGCRPDLAQYRAACPRSPGAVAPDGGLPGANAAGLCYNQPLIPCEFCMKSLPVYLINEHQERCGRDANMLFVD